MIMPCTCPTCENNLALAIKITQHLKDEGKTHRQASELLEQTTIYSLGIIDYAIEQVFLPMQAAAIRQHEAEDNAQIISDIDCITTLSQWRTDLWQEIDNIEHMIKIGVTSETLLKYIAEMRKFQANKYKTSKKQVQPIPIKQTDTNVGQVKQDAELSSTLIEYPHYIKWQNKDGFWEVKRVLDDAGKYNYLCECADEKIAAKICDDWNTQVQQCEISVIYDEAMIELLSPYVHHGTRGWMRMVAEKCLETIKPYLRSPVREIGYRAGENVPSRDHNFAELIAVPIEQMNDIHRHLRNLIALGQIHIKDFDTQPKEITDLKGKIFAEAESAVLFVRNWATRNRKPTEIEGQSS